MATGLVLLLVVATVACLAAGAGVVALAISGGFALGACFHEAYARG